jgi:hypothetical protein
MAGVGQEATSGQAFARAFSDRTNIEPKNSAAMTLCGVVIAK